MSSYGLVRVLRSCVIGWVALLAVVFLIERPLIHLTALILDPSWLPTAQLALECLGLAAVGWLIGRWGDRWGVLIFAGTLALPNLGHVTAIDFPWLVRLLVDCFQNTRYLGAFVRSLATQSFLFAALFIGSRLSRTRQPVVLHIQ
jgi:hypothetical protein